MAVISAMIVMTIVMSLLNLFIVMPLYINVVGMKLNMSIPQYVATGVIPFNIIKSLIASIGTAIIYPRLKGHLSFQNVK
jgi:riboflavin transporter FmnP